VTNLDAVRVVRAVRGVDGDCGPCVSHVCVKLVKAFPDLNWRLVLTEALVSKELWSADFVRGILREAGPTRACACGKVAYGTAFLCESCKKTLHG